MIPILWQAENDDSFSELLLDERCREAIRTPPVHTKLRRESPQRVRSVFFRRYSDVQIQGTRVAQRTTCYLVSGYSQSKLRKYKDYRGRSENPARRGHRDSLFTPKKSKSDKVLLRDSALLPANFPCWQGNLAGTCPQQTTAQNPGRVSTVFSPSELIASTCAHRFAKGTGVVWLALLATTVNGENWRGTQMPAAPQNLFAELRRPTYRQQNTNRGWEVRSHRWFIRSGNGPRQAEWTHQHLEEAWKDMSRLADPWTRIHRSPGFVAGPTLIQISSEPNRRSSGETMAAAGQRDYGSLYFQDSFEHPLRQSRVPEIRGTATRVFLQQTRLSQNLPAWVQDGLVSYVSQPRLTPAEINAAEKSAAVHYFLRANDATFAPLFFDALKATVQMTDSRLQRRTPTPPRWSRRGRLLRQPWYVPAVSNTPVDRLLASPRMKAAYSNWVRDPEFGRPVYQPAHKLDPKRLQREREMVLLLKLASRYEKQISTRISAWSDQEEGGDKTGEASSENDFPLADLESLYRFLTRSGQRWATLDVDNSLMLSTDSRRIETLFANHRSRYHMVRHQGRQAIASSWDSHKTLIAWLQPNPDNPSRPIARIVLQ